MKKIVLMLVAIFTLSLTATSCRDTKSTKEKVEDKAEEVKEEVEDKAEDVKKAVEEGAEEVEEEIEGEGN